MVYIIIAVVTAYLIGSIPTAVWVGRIFYKVDVREHGSGNAGATNTLRVLGWKAGVPVLLIDGLKGWAGVAMAGLLGLAQIYPAWFVNLQIVCGAAAVLGHIFPLYAGFRGGKGVATIVGVVTALVPFTVFTLLALFLAIFFSSGFVSLASITTALAFPVVMILLYGERHPSLIVFALLIALFIPITHRKNIRRLIHGEESRFSFRKK